jgi:hypothetical protein
MILADFDFAKNIFEKDLERMPAMINGNSVGIAAMAVFGLSF